jgi:zinc transporter ZupT
VLRHEIAWMPTLGLHLTLRMDGFAWLFAGLVTGIGFLLVLYARYYMSPEDPVPRFFAFLLAFMGSMLGLVLSGNLIQLVFFWELTSLSSFLLIGYWRHLPEGRQGARMALAGLVSAGRAGSPRGRHDERHSSRPPGRLLRPHQRRVGWRGAAAMGRARVAGRAYRAGAAR